MSIRRRRSTLPVGLYSQGTLRPEDLIESLRWDINRVRLSKNDRLAVRRLYRGFDTVTGTDDDPDLGWDDRCHEIWQALCDIVDQYAPEYCYFGSTDGDGACIGMWPSIDAIETAVADGEVWKSHRDGGYMRGHGTHAERWNKPHAPRTRMEVSDHGNVTYYCNGKEIWSAV